MLAIHVLVFVVCIAKNVHAKVIFYSIPTTQMVFMNRGMHVMTSYARRID